MAKAKTSGVYTSSPWKAAVRQRVAKSLDDSAVVFEACIGEGGMYAAAWHRFRGIGLDLNEACVMTAARTRPRWLCMVGDSERFALGGGLASCRVDVLDLDFFGSPWPTLSAILSTRKTWQPTTHVFLTDGHAGRSNVQGADRALMPGVGRSAKIPVAMARAHARTEVGKAARAAGLVARWHDEHRNPRGPGIWYYYLTLARAGQS